MALHCSFTFTSVVSNPPGSVKFSQPIVKASAFPSTLSPPNVRLNFKGKSILGFRQFSALILYFDADTFKDWYFLK